MALLHRSGRTESSVLQLATCTVKLLVLLLLLGLSLTVATARSSTGEKIDSAAEQMPQRTISLHSVAESSHRRPRNAFNSVQNTYPRTPYISFSDTSKRHVLVEETKRRSRRAVTANQQHVWPSGIIPYAIDPIFSGSSRATFMRAMRTWESKSCVSFVEKESRHQSYIHFTIEAYCESDAGVIQELGHILGFWYEHIRPDRDDYVEIIKENIQPGMLRHFEKLTRTEVDSLGKEYDYSSIMHFRRDAFAKPDKNETIRPKQCCPRPVIGEATQPSAGDFRQVNKLYKCPCRYCGSKLPPLLVSESSRMLIEYKRPAGQSSTGFVADYLVVCGESLKADKGVFTSPGYPSNYLPNKQCIWKIEVSAGFAVVLSFVTFGLEEQSDCSYNHLEIVDGPSEDSPILRKLCGLDIPATIRSTSNRVTVRFTTDSVLGSQRFAASFEKVSPEQIGLCGTTNHGCEHICVNIPGGYKCRCHRGYNLHPNGKTCTAVCGGSMKADRGKFRSPGYPHTQMPDQDCIWNIEVPPGQVVSLSIDPFELRELVNCSFNHLEIFDGPSHFSFILRKLCGLDLPTTIRSTSNTMTVRLISDNSNGDQRFTANFQGGECL
ncbi:hypothetical protein AAHC03_019022 [Spirometra sp. Aus1]